MRNHIEFGKMTNFLHNKKSAELRSINSNIFINRFGYFVIIASLMEQLLDVGLKRDSRFIELLSNPNCVENFQQWIIKTSRNVFLWIIGFTWTFIFCPAYFYAIRYDSTPTVESCNNEYENVDIVVIHQLFV